MVSWSCVKNVSRSRERSASDRWDIEYGIHGRLLAGASVEDLCTSRTTTAPTSPLPRHRPRGTLSPVPAPSPRLHLAPQVHSCPSPRSRSPAAPPHVYLQRARRARPPASSPGVEVQVPFRGRPRKGSWSRSRARTRCPRAPRRRGSRGHARRRRCSARTCSPSRAGSPTTTWRRWGEVLAAALPGGLEGFAKSRAAQVGGRGSHVARWRSASASRSPPASARRWRRSSARSSSAAASHRSCSTASPPAARPSSTCGAADRVRQGGGQTLVLVPEVALGSQLVREFRRRFGSRVGVLHSYSACGRAAPEELGARPPRGAGRGGRARARRCSRRCPISS